MVDLHIQESKIYITEMRIYQQCFWVTIMLLKNTHLIPVVQGLIVE